MPCGEDNELVSKKLDHLYNIYEEYARSISFREVLKSISLILGIAGALLAVYFYLFNLVFDVVSLSFIIIFDILLIFVFGLLIHYSVSFYRKITDQIVYLEEQYLPENARGLYYVGKSFRPSIVFMRRSETAEKVENDPAENNHWERAEDECNEYTLAKLNHLYRLYENYLNHYFKALDRSIYDVTIISIAGASLILSEISVLISITKLAMLFGIVIGILGILFFTEIFIHKNVRDTNRYFEELWGVLSKIENIERRCSPKIARYRKLPIKVKT